LGKFWKEKNIVIVDGKICEKAPWNIGMAVITRFLGIPSLFAHILDLATILYQVNNIGVYMEYLWPGFNQLIIQVIQVHA